MKKKIFTVLSILCLVSNLFAQYPNFEWAAGFGSVSQDMGKDIVVDSEGYVYTTGTFNFTVDFDPGPGVFELTSDTNSGIFFTKFDPNGGFVWAKMMGGNYATGIEIDSLGYIYSVGLFDDSAEFDPGPMEYWMYSNGPADIYLTKMDNSGNLIWAKQIGDVGYNWCYSLDLDKDANIYLSASYNSTFDIDPDTTVYYLNATGSRNIFVLKLNSDGQFIWAKGMPGSGYVTPKSISVGGDGSIATSGFFSGTFDFDPDPLGTLNLTSNGSDDIYVVKLNPSGDLIWAKSIGGSGIDWCYSVAMDNSGNVFTTGRFQQTVDFDPGPSNYFLTSVGSNDRFTLKLDSSGNFSWVETIGGTGGGDGYSITTDKNGNVYTTGNFSGFAYLNPGSGGLSLNSNGGSDLFIVKYDLNGNPYWAINIGSNGTDKGYAIEADDNGSIYVTGSYNSNVDFDPGIGTYYPPTGYANDAYILKLKGCDHSYSSISETSCVSYYFNNTELTQSGIYYGTLVNSTGCDSIITLDLTIIEVDISVTQQANDLTANAIGVTYQWIDCQNGNTPILGATNQSFTPTQNGSYAVIVTQSGCTDTSSCYTISTIGIEGVEALSGIKIFPNPAKDRLYIDLGNSLGSKSGPRKNGAGSDLESHPDWQSTVELINIKGQVVLIKKIATQTKLEFDLRHLPVGEYFVKIVEEGKQVFVEKIMKE